MIIIVQFCGKTFTSRQYHAVYHTGKILHTEYGRNGLHKVYFSTFVIRWAAQSYYIFLFRFLRDVRNLDQHSWRSQLRAGPISSAGNCARERSKRSREVLPQCCPPKNGYCFFFRLQPSRVRLCRFQRAPVGVDASDRYVSASHAPLGHAPRR